VGAAVANWSETLLITENKTVLLELGRDGKFSAKSAAWEENKVILLGEELVFRVDRGRWLIVKQGTTPGQGAPANAGAQDDEVLVAPVAPQPLTVAPQPPPVAPQPPLRCNCCAATAYFPRPTH
jgi:hypothetical protein